MYHRKQSNQGVSQGASRTEDGQKAPAQNVQRPGCLHKWQKSNRWRKHCGNEDGEDRVPSTYLTTRLRRRTGTQCPSCLAAFSADLPRRMPAQDTTHNRTRRQQPWVSPVRHKPQKQQVSAPGKGRGNTEESITETENRPRSPIRASQCGITVVFTWRE